MRTRLFGFWRPQARPSAIQTPSQREAATRLSAFVAATTPWGLEPWQEIACDRLQRLAAGGETGQRLLLHGPPQFGKSILVSQRLPAWCLGANPLLRVRLCCYNVTHAARFGKVNLEVVRMPQYAAIFPSPDCRVPARSRAGEWSTLRRLREMDGQASFVALGIGSGFTGLGADLLIVDDPYKNREEAYSTVINENVWSWWTDVVIPRLNPTTNVVVMFHRWREDDLAGRLMAQGGWESIRFPAICDGGPDDPTFVRGLRREGDPLSPRYPVSYLREQVEAKQGPSSFLALYQGRPVADGGNLFREEWFTHAYRDLPPLRSVWTCWDTALKGGQENDETACVTAGLGDDGNLYLLRVAHGHWETPDVARFLAEQADWCRAVYGRAYAGDYVEDKVSGTTLMQYVRRARPDLALIPLKAEADKVARARGVTPLCETGRVRPPDGAMHAQARRGWEELMAQLRTFPGGRRDDMVDAFVYALQHLLTGAGGRKSRRGNTGGMW